MSKLHFSLTKYTSSLNNLSIKLFDISHVFLFSEIFFFSATGMVRRHVAGRQD